MARQPWTYVCNREEGCGPVPGGMMNGYDACTMPCTGDLVAKQGPCMNPAPYADVGCAVQDTKATRKITYECAADPAFPDMCREREAGLPDFEECTLSACVPWSEVNQYPDVKHQCRATDNKNLWISCGEGLSYSTVSCPTPNMCDPTQRPLEQKPCNKYTCVWGYSPWETTEVGSNLALRSQPFANTQNMRPTLRSKASQISAQHLARKITTKKA
jgi:hypothetical protein